MEPAGMTENADARENDMAGSVWRLLKIWGPAYALFLLSGNFGWWSLTIGWTAALLWMGAMCVLNARRCRRVHCSITGPFFLIMAVVTLLVGFRVVSFGENTWPILGGVIVAGGVGLWVLPEAVWGRYWKAKRDG